MGHNLIVGYGEIGQALHKVIGPSLVHDPVVADVKPGVEVDVMHVTFPYTENFVHQVRHYQNLFDPSLTIIYSTVAIGTTREIGGRVAHSPIEGTHPDLENGIRFVRWISADSKSSLDAAEEFWGFLTNNIKLYRDSRHTEFLKLRSTSKYAVNIEWTRYEKMVADDIDMDFEAIKDFDRTYNEIYEDDPRYQRYILDPPEGSIGGHCLVPNAAILNKQYPNPWLEEVK